MRVFQKVYIQHKKKKKMEKKETECRNVKRVFQMRYSTFFLTNPATHIII